MSTAESSSIASVTSKIDRQELRIYQHDVKELRAAYDSARKRELEASKMLNMEKLRCQNQEMEIQRRREQIKESNEFIRKLQNELEDAKRTASGVKRELRENEIKSLLDTEIIQYKAQIAGLEDKLKSKQRNLEKVSEVLRERNALMERELALLNGELAQKEQVYSETIAQLRECGGAAEIGEFRERLDRLNQQIGSLKAINDSLQDKINGMQAERFELENKLRYAVEDKATLQSQIDSLKDQMSDTEGNNQQLLRTLNDEIDKIKQQKAQLRCDYLQLKRNFTALELEKKALSDQIESTKQVDVDQQKRHDEMKHEYEEILSKNTDLQKQIGTLKKELENQRKQTEDLERLVEENETCTQTTIRQLKLALEKEQAAKKEITDVVVALDSESERMLSKLRDVTQEKKAAVLDSQSLKHELNELRTTMASQCRTQNELETMREENDRLKLRIEFLENELTKSRTEHRIELDRLAEHMTASAPTAAMAILKSGTSEPELLYRSVEELQRALKQRESQCSYMERSVEQNKKELESVNKQMADMHKRQFELVNDNTLLRQALAEAVKKAEKYRDESNDLKSSKNLLTSDVDRYQQKLQQMEDELYELRAELGQKEKLVAYLQSNQHPKQMQKLKRNRSSFSTLISVSNDSTSEFELESQECEELQKKRDWLRRNLEQQRRVLTEKQMQMERNWNESVPLLKTTTAARALADVDYRSVAGGYGTEKVASHSPDSKDELTASPRIGTMRHDIHHIWKTQFITITTSQCCVCYEGVPHLGHIKKCIKCSLVVHARCLPNIMNTCGLPAGYADYYLGSHAAPLGSMNGWVKLWSSDDRAGNKWRNAWAIIDSNQLDFYDSDQLAMSNGPPFRSINLDADQWRIFNQMLGNAVDEVVLSTETAPMVIEIKLKNSSLYMLTPTLQAKQRWVQALQLAINRRLQRRASNATSSPCSFSMLMSLESPMNLAIHCTQILDDEWLLIGCEEGLFATNLQFDPPRAPFRIADVKSIFFMETISEQDMLLVICDKKRIPAAIHLQQLRRALRAEDLTVQYTPISGVFDCHTAVVSKPEHNRKRYIYLATTNSIHVLQFVEKLGVFSPVKQIKTDEPCMCICSTPFGFLYGADKFNVATFDNDFVSVPISINNCPFDMPVSTVEISANEYLLAYANYGVFVDAHGERTRNENVEWSRLPLEFVYTVPYLYIVNCDFLEIVRVASFEGSGSPGFTEDRSMFKCRSAHKTGLGRSASEVIFSVSSEDRVELHIFRTENDSQFCSKSILKRKIADTLSRPTTKKRH